MLVLCLILSMICVTLGLVMKYVFDLRAAAKDYLSLYEKNFEYINKVQEKVNNSYNECKQEIVNISTQISRIEIKKSDPIIVNPGKGRTLAQRAMASEKRKEWWKRKKLIEKSMELKLSEEAFEELLKKYYPNGEEAQEILESYKSKIEKTKAAIERAIAAS